MKVMMILPAITLCACTSVTPPRSTTGAPRAGIQQTANVDSLFMTPLSVIEDSRCPADVQCVWAGRLIVRTEVSGGQWSKRLDLTLGQPQPVADGAITLTSAVPAKNSRQPIRPADYRFTFAFSGGL